MKRFSKTIALGMVLCSIFIAANLWAAQFKPGDVIDKTNWQKAEGMLPAPVLEDVKKGDYNITIGKLNYSPDEFFKSNVIKENWESNKGKYKLTDDLNVVDAKSGQIAYDIKGIPFPDLEECDPRFAEKLMYNFKYGMKPHGNQYNDFQMTMMTRKGYERDFSGNYLSFEYKNLDLTKDLNNPDGFDSKSISLIKKPYDMKGIAVFSMQYIDTAKDSVIYTYVPSIRRARRGSPANRSDAFGGSDFVTDDNGGFSGPIQTMKWKLLETKEMLVPFFSADPCELYKNSRGGWESVNNFNQIKLGYTVEGWQGAPWALTTNIIWVPRKIYVLEMTPVNKNYNYGVHMLYVDAGMQKPVMKEMTDRANQGWKYMLMPGSALSTPDGSYRYNFEGMNLIVDFRNDHATFNRDSANRTRMPHNPGTFTLSGFTKFCK